MDLLLSLLRGVPATLAVTFGAFIMGLFLAIPIVLMRRSSHLFLMIPARIFIDVIRGIPPIVWLFIIFFGLGSGIFVLSPFVAAVIGMGLVSTAYIAEIYRGGFLALPKSQHEAGKALGLNRLDILLHVLSPQVLKVSVPPLATYFVSLLKDTAVASTISVRDILMYASQEAQSGGGGFEPFILAALLYIILSIPVGVFSRIMDGKLRSQGGVA